MITDHDAAKGAHTYFGIYQANILNLQVPFRELDRDFVSMDCAVLAPGCNG
jgi:hypothetical protein